MFGTPKSSTPIAGLHLDLTAAGAEGYVIRSVTVGGHAATVIAANQDVGVLHGVFHFLRLMQTRQSLEQLDISSAPRIQHRILDHWDNLDGTVERGYAGESIWDWYTLPEYLDPRYTDYARACASLGINGAVLDQRERQRRSADARYYLDKVAALAKVFRPYGIRVYLSARFSAPVGDRRPQDSRSSRSGRCGLVARQGRRDLPRRFPISAASSSRPTPKGSRGRRTTIARMPTAPT